MNEPEIIPFRKNVPEKKRIEPVEDRGDSRSGGRSVSADRGGYYLSGKQVIAIWCLCLVLSVLMFTAGWISRDIVSDRFLVEYAERPPAASYRTTESYDNEALFSDPRRMLLDRFLSLEIPLSDITSGHVPEKSSFTILSDGFWRNRDTKDDLILSIPESEYGIPENMSVRILVDALADKGDALDLAKRLKQRDLDATVFRMADSERKTWFVVTVDNAADDSLPADSAARFIADENLRAFAAVFPTNNLQTVSPVEDKVKIETLRTDISHPYTLRIAAYRKHANAKKGIAIFKNRGFSRLMVGGIVSKSRKKWLYVYSGWYETREEAARAQQTDAGLKGSVITKAPYSIFIKPPVSGNDLETTSLLDKKGYLAYHFLEYPGKSRKLMIGAFSSISEAEVIRNGLIKNGLECEIVER